MPRAARPRSARARSNRWSISSCDRADARVRRALVDELTRNLAHVRSAVADWPALQAAMRADAARWSRDGNIEGGTLLRWFNDRAMTLLGHDIWYRDGQRSDELGIARHQFDVPLLADTSRDRRARLVRRRAAPRRCCSSRTASRPSTAACRSTWSWCRCARAARSSACRCTPACGPRARSTPPARRAGAARAAGDDGGQVRLRSQGPYRQGADPCADRAAARPDDRRSSPPSSSISR